MKIEISPYVWGELSGSAISQDGVESGYDPQLEAAVRKLSSRGGWIDLDSPALRDLAEWADAMANAVRQGENYSGARSLEKLSWRCVTLADRAAARIAAAEGAIRGHGFTIRYVEWCEDAETPGLLGSILGATNHDRRIVKIATHRRSSDEIAETLEHELRHVEDPLWDCGSGNALGTESGAARRRRAAGLSPESEGVRDRASR